MYAFYESPQSLDEALTAKARHGERARIIAGGTDLLLELARGVRVAPGGKPLGLIDLTRVPGLADIWTETVDGRTWIHLGPLVTHNQCVASPLIGDHAFALARACWEVGAPQIRNRATIAGNIITASPANDSIPPLLALDATVTVQSAARGVRTLPLQQFITAFRQVDLAVDEMLTRISFPALRADQRSTFIKLGLRRAQAISVVNVAIALTFETPATPDAQPTDADLLVKSAAVSLGAVSPVVVRAAAAEAYLVRKPLNDEVMREAARLALQSATPIDDIRSSAAYRLDMVEALVARALLQLRTGQERQGWPARPVLLWGDTDGKWPAGHPQAAHTDASATSGSGKVVASVNGQPAELLAGMTLLDSLRAAGFHGVKEGCAEGECGACTVFLDGMAVMACLAPSERAAGSRVITVEGLGNPAQLHPVQAAFVQSGGVQCGYCTPGFVMSAAKLLEERPHPTRGEAQEALTGNLCRCTGYRKILDAVVLAGERTDIPKQ